MVCVAVLPGVLPHFSSEGKERRAEDRDRHTSTEGLRNRLLGTPSLLHISV